MGDGLRDGETEGLMAIVGARLEEEKGGVVCGKLDIGDKGLDG